MAKSLGNLVLKVQMENKRLLAKLEQSEKRIKRFQKKTTGMAKQFASAFTQVMIPAMTAFGAAAGTTFANFEDTMLRVQAVSGATSGEFESMTAAAMEMGRTTRFTASEAASGLQFLSMAGLEASESVQALDDTLKLALISGADMGRAADILTNVMSGFSLQVSELGRVNDILAASITSSNQNIDEQAQALAKVAGIAPATNQKLEDMTAITQVLANQGIKAEEAGTAIRMMLTRLLKPTGSAIDIFDKYSIALKNADGTMRPLIQIMEDFEEKGVTQAEIMEVFGARAGPKFIAALQGGTEELKLMAAELEHSNGAAENMANTIDSGLKANFLELKSKVEDVMLTMGGEGGFGSMLSGLIDDLKSMVDLIKDNVIPVMNVLKTAWITGKVAMQLFFQGIGILWDGMIKSISASNDAILKFVQSTIEAIKSIPGADEVFGASLEGGRAAILKARVNNREYFKGLETGVFDSARSPSEIIEEEIAAMEAAGIAADELRKKEEERRLQAKKDAKATAEANEALDNANQSLEGNTGALKDNEGQAGLTTEALQRLKAHGYEELDDTSMRVSTGMSDAFRDTARSIILETENIGDAFEAMGKRIFDTLANAIFDQTVGNAISSAVSGIGIDGIFSGGFGGFFADGGRPPVGKTSIVGENGPELFVPDSAGTVIPNHALSSVGGGTTVVQNISIHPDVPGTTQRVIMENLPMIKEAAAKGVEEKVLRGGQYSKNIRG